MRHRQAERQAALLDVVEQRQRLIPVVAERLDADLAEELLRLGVVAGIDIDRDTSKASLPFSFCSASSAGISARQGAHHVAHRLSSTVLPAWSASVIGLPSGSLKARLFSDCGGSAGNSAATWPGGGSRNLLGAVGLCRAGGIVLAVAGGDAGAAAALLPEPLSLTYTATAPASTPATKAARIRRGAGK